MVDCERLISYVKERPQLWDKRNKLHSNRHLVDRCWNEISAEMNTDEIVLRKKWKYLRDQYAVERGKLIPMQSADGTEYTPTRSRWRYFESLQFLNDIVKPRMSSGAIRVYLTSENAGGREEAHNSDTDASVDADASIETDITEGHEHSEGWEINSWVNSPLVYQEGSKKRKLNEEPGDSRLKIEEKTLQYLLDKSVETRDKNDEDMLFFKSLMPHVRKIPQHKKLRFRSRVQETVDEFAYSAPVTVKVSSSPVPQTYQSHNSASDSHYHC